MPVQTVSTQVEDFDWDFNNKGGPTSHVPSTPKGSPYCLPQENHNFWTKFGNSVHSVFSKLVYNKEKFLQIQMMIYSHISWENAMVLLLQMPDDNWFYCYLNGKRAITKVVYPKYYNKLCLCSGTQNLLKHKEKP